MRPVRLLGPVLFIAGIAALVVAFVQGQATLNLFIVFPVVTATGGWAVLGILLLVAGFFLFFITWPLGTAVVSPPAETGVPPPSATSAPSAAVQTPPRRWGGVVFVGPIPVVFGSDQKVAGWMLVLGVVLFVALVVLTVIALRGI